MVDHLALRNGGHNVLAFFGKTCRNWTGCSFFGPPFGPQNEAQVYKRKNTHTVHLTHSGSNVYIYICHYMPFATFDCLLSGRVPCVGFEPPTFIFFPGVAMRPVCPLGRASKPQDLLEGWPPGMCKPLPIVGDHPSHNFPSSKP